MKCNVKRVLSLILGLALLLSVVPASVFATTREDVPVIPADEIPTEESAVAQAEVPTEAPVTEDEQPQEVPEPESSAAPVAEDLVWNIPDGTWYVWDFAQGSVTNTAGSSQDNTLSLVTSANSEITAAEDLLKDGTLDASTRAVLKMSQPITLDASSDWTVALVAKTDGENSISSFLSTHTKRNGVYFFISADGDLSITKKGSFTADDGTVVENEYVYYKVSDTDYAASVLASEKFDPTQYHSYQLACRDGVFSFWLDGRKVGDLTLSETTSKRGSGKPQYTQGTGTPFDFSSITMQYMGCGTTSAPTSLGLFATVKLLSISTNSGTLTRVVGLEEATAFDSIVTYPGQTIELVRPDTGDYCAKLVGWAENPDGTGKLYQVGDIYTVTGMEAVTLYGIWQTRENGEVYHTVVDGFCTYCGVHVHEYTAQVAEKAYFCNKENYDTPATYYTSCFVCGLTSQGTEQEDTFEYGRPGDGYYSVVTKNDWDTAPGVKESEIILNNSTGDRRQVVHVMEVDLSNPYVSVMPSYMGMNPTVGNYQLGTLTEQVTWAQKNMGLNVVGAMNTSLTWYTTEYYDQHPELVGEPTGILVINGTVYSNKTGADTCLVINFDQKDGVARPADMPKVELRNSVDGITGWEEQVIPCNFGFVVKDGKNTDKSPDHGNQASKSVLGVKADGTIVIMQNDGRQSPYSGGLSIYEIGEVMISLGCVYAVRCDGGGTSTYLSQRPGEGLTMKSSCSDGSERPTTTGIMVISTAPSDGSFAKANIAVDHAYYAPGSTVTFSAIGADLAGARVDIPADAQWQIKESGMGTIENGVFVSNGTTGTVTAQIVYHGKVVGQRAIEIVIPEEFRFQQSTITVPFGKTVTMRLVATVHDGLNTVVIDSEDVQITTTNPALGTFDGIRFTAVAEENAPADLTSTITATVKGMPELAAKAQLNLGKGSELLEDFENGLDRWKVTQADAATGYDYVAATAENGYVFDGSYSAGIYFNNRDQQADAVNYSRLRLIPKESIILKNATSVGAWVYIPDDFYNLWIQLTVYTKDSEGEYSVAHRESPIEGGNVYTKIEESGWYYVSCDISGYDSVMISSEARFIEIISQHCSTNALLQTTGSPHGMSQVYVDNITVDYSAAADDREPPVFQSVSLLHNGAEVSLSKRQMVTTSHNVVSFRATVAEDETMTNATGLDPESARVYVDGKRVEATYVRGVFTVESLALANGVHRVKFEISDYAGNKSVAIRVIKIASVVKASTIEVVPADPTLDRLYGGSVYWMDLNATMIETVQEVSLDIDLNAVNHWELEHMVLADGFTASYTVDGKTNTASITIVRTGENTQTGLQTLASLPIRVIYFDTDIALAGYTAHSFWNTYDFWPQDVAVDVDRGQITYVDGYSTKAQNTFSSAEFSVDTEMYTTGHHMDIAFKAERGTAHVHKAIALEDKAASCLESGYTDRTYCDICASVVKWGQTLPAIGHKYAEKNSLVTCLHCGEKRTGLWEGKTYQDGILVEGWIDGVYYYEDGVMVTGPHAIDGKLYTFGEDGVYDPDFIYTDFFETKDGKLMYFVNNEAVSGYYYLNGHGYYFDADGYGFQGEYIMAGETCFFDKGSYVSCSTADVICAGMAGPHCSFVLYTNGTFKLAGTGATYEFTNHGDRPFAEEAWRIKRLEVAVGITRIGAGFMMNSYVNTVVFPKNSVLKEIGSNAFKQCHKLKTIELPMSLTSLSNSSFGNCNTLTKVVLPASAKNFHTKTFENWKTLTLYVVDGSPAMKYAVSNNIPYAIYVPSADGPEVLHGIVEVDGILYYYKDGMPYYAGLIQEGDTYYYVNEDNVVVTGIYYVSKTNGLKDPGYYLFDKTGKLIRQIQDGIQEFDGIRYYYKDGKPYFAGVVEADGSYYYFGEDGKQVTSTCEVTKTNGLVEPGIYDFDETGKMIIILKNGIFEENGGLYYYRDGEPYYAGLVSHEGSYYYFGQTGKAVTGTNYITKTNGLKTPGYCLFDETGKLVMELPDGILQMNGVLYYYRDGAPYYAGLVQIGEDYYYADVAGKIVVGEYEVTKTNDLMEPGIYTFGPDGKMIIILKNGVVEEDGALYYYQDDELYYAGLVSYEGSYYYFGENGKAVTGAYYVNKTNDLMEPGYYSFDATGKLVGRIDTGIVEIAGVLYYYRDGSPFYAGLIQIDGDYYYVNSSCRVVTGKYFVNKTNGLMDAGYYTFDQTGKMIKDSDGAIVEENGVLYYYKNGEKTYAGLVKIGDDYYYVNSSCRVVTGRYFVNKSNGLLPSDYYFFGPDGKMVQKNGVVAEDGALYYYKNGERNYAGLVEIDGYYYYVNSSCRVVTGKYYVNRNNGLKESGYYFFDENGRMDQKTGIFEENGVLRYYENGFLTYAGLIQIDGYYYYVNSSAKVVTGKYYISKTNGLMPNDHYVFEEDGRMNMKNGIVAENGGLYYYRNGGLFYAGLVLIDGDYYYVNSKAQVVTGRYEIWKTNDLLPADTYFFDQTGKMIRS